MATVKRYLTKIPYARRADSELEEESTPNRQPLGSLCDCKCVNSHILNETATADRHHARIDDGELIGCSEIEVKPLGKQSGLLVSSATRLKLTPVEPLPVQNLLNFGRLHHAQQPTAVQ